MFGILAGVQAIAYHQTHLKWLMWVALALCIKALLTKTQRMLNISGVIVSIIVMFLL
ncbi:MAG: hypothetical protein J0H87_00675 [Holosporales bacterium]|nr:hypothetical protein [Holosporales bacterium]